jgi:hypothetical protein
MDMTLKTEKLSKRTKVRQRGKTKKYVIPVTAHPIDIGGENIKVMLSPSNTSEGGYIKSCYPPVKSNGGENIKFSYPRGGGKTLYYI